jgi:hypothetical protein
VNEWLVREAERQARHPRLEHALLTDRATGYVFYRMQFMWLRVFVRCAVHVLEITLLASAMVPGDWLAGFIGYRTSTGLLSSLYWGGLEQMRHSVRTHMKRRHIGSARLEIHNWLRVSAVMGVFGVCAFGAWIALSRPNVQGLSLFGLFGLACFVRLGFDLWARTLHSGIFAQKRVYRPLWSLLLPDCLEITTLIVVFPRLGLLAFPAMVVVGGLIRIGLANHYSKRAYRSSRVAPPTIRETVLARHTITRADLGSAIKFGVSNATSQLDGLIIMLLLFAGRASDESGVTFAGVYYVLRPLMAVAHSWARTFYFDFKRIETGSRLFQQRFRSLLTRTAIALACVVALLVLGITTLLSGGAPPLSFLSLVPFFVARSLMSVRQLDAFAAGQHGPLLRVSVGLLGALGLAAWLLRDQALVMLAASLLSVVGYILLPSRPAPRVFGHVIGLPRWLAQLNAETAPTRITVLTIDRSLTTAVRLIRRLCPLIDSGSIARFGGSYVLVFERSVTAKLGAPANVAVACDGALAGYVGARGRDGKDALREAIDCKALPKELISMLKGDPTADLVAEYQRAHPHGTVIDAIRGRVSGGKTLQPRELRAVMTAISLQSRGGLDRSRQRLNVIVYAPGGEPETIFVTPAHTRPSAVFRHRVQTATLRASLRDTPR